MRAKCGNLVTSVPKVLLEIRLVALHSLQLLVKSFVFALLKLTLLLLFFDLAHKVPFSIPHFLDSALLIFDVPLSLLAALYPGLKFKIFLLKAS